VSFIFKPLARNLHGVTVPKNYDAEPILAAFGSPEHPRSSVWRLWVQKDEVYFGARTFLGGFKVSLHEPRIVWIPHSHHRAMILLLSLAKPEADFDPVRYLPEILVGRRKKSNGEWACLLAHERELNNEMTKTIRFVMSETMITLKSMKQYTATQMDARAYSIADNKIGLNSPLTIYDISLGWENVQTQETKP
jgi:hypothetical protein